MNHYTIKDMETLSGIKAHTIRIWEKRYGLLSPERSTTNIRYYSDQELRKLLNVSMLVKHGYKISKVSTFDEEVIRTEVLKLNGKTSEFDAIIDQLIIHMVNFDELHFIRLTEEKIREFGFEKTISKIIFPLFYKIGLFWQTGSLFPAQEHFVSNLIRQRLIVEASMYTNFKATKTVLFFLKEGEQHEIGLLFLNYLSLKLGYKTIYLGQNVPYEDLVRTLKLKNTDYFFTAFVNAMEKEELETYFEKLNELTGGKKVFVSGKQILELAPKLPSNFKVVDDLDSFYKYLPKL